MSIRSFGFVQTRVLGSFPPYQPLVLVLVLTVFSKVPGCLSESFRPLGCATWLTLRHLSSPAPWPGVENQEHPSSSQGCPNSRPHTSLPTGVAFLASVDKNGPISCIAAGLLLLSQTVKNLPASLLTLLPSQVALPIGVGVVGEIFSRPRLARLSQHGYPRHL